MVKFMRTTSMVTTHRRVPPRQPTGTDFNARTEVVHPAARVALCGRTPLPQRSRKGLPWRPKSNGLGEGMGKEPRTPADRRRIVGLGPVGSRNGTPFEKQLHL